MTSPTPRNVPSAYNLAEEAWAYWMDAGQRWILFLDVMQQRGERYLDTRPKRPRMF